MEKNVILETLGDIIRETFDIEDIEVTEKTVAADIPGWDSLSHMLLMMTVEQSFDVELTDKTAYKNVGELVEIIHQKKNS